MNCEQVQSWLLQAESLQFASYPTELADHVRSCPACAKWSSDLLQLEDAWRQLPLPTGCESAKAKFLQELPKQAPSAKPVRRRWMPARWAVAAVLLLGLGGLAWLVAPGESRASSDLVERLIEWNLELTSADVADRQRLLSEKEASFREDLKKEQLPVEERELAEELLENGRKMATNDDPLEEADGFTKLADKLVGRIDTATQTGSTKETQRNASRYCKVMERGVTPNMDRVAHNKNLQAKKKVHVDRIINSDLQQEQHLEQLMERAPEHARPEVRKALDASRKRPRHHHHHKK